MDIHAGVEQPGSDAMGIFLRVATINILNDLSRWHDRRGLLVQGLNEFSPDLIALQEVTEPLGESTAHWLAGELGGYTVHVCPKSGRSRRREAIAILSRLPVEDHELLDLGSQQRTAQIVFVRAGGSSVVFCNGHYHWPPGAHAARVRQVGRILERVERLDLGVAVIACGDFNGTPGSPAIAAMRRTFASAHEAHHGKEPDYTCPTPLVSGHWIREVATRRLLRFFTNRPGDSWRGTLDYIFVSPNVRVVECDVFLDHPSPDDPTLYASDHLGLAAILEIPSAADS
jgi:endonuclease/exonuclease/phosphatase family metal-dependent hydrolase